MRQPLILYNNIFTISVTATDTEAVGDYDPAYIVDLRDYTYWRAASAGTKYLTIDAGVNVAADTIGLTGHNLTSATVSVESSSTGAWAGEEVTRLAGFTPQAGPELKTFTSATDRYWRVKIVSASVAPEVAVVILGKRMDFPVYPDAPLTERTESVNADDNTSKTGHLLGVHTRFTPVRVSHNFTMVPVSWYDSDYLDFWRDHGRLLKPFFYAPNLDLWPDRVYWLRLMSNATFGGPHQNDAYLDKFTFSAEGRV